MTNYYHLFVEGIFEKGYEYRDSQTITDHNYWESQKYLGFIFTEII